MALNKDWNNERKKIVQRNSSTLTSYNHMFTSLKWRELTLGGKGNRKKNAVSI